MTKTTYTVTSPLTGKVHTRSSTKTNYTHVALVTVRRHDGSVFEEVSYRATKAAAEASVRTLLKNWADLAIAHAVVEALVTAEAR